MNLQRANTSSPRVTQLLARVSRLNVPTPPPILSQSIRIQNLVAQLPRLELQTPLRPLTEFTIFNRLPRELRSLIWKLAAHVSRLVILEPEVFNIYAAHRPHQWWGQSRVPAILHASSEAREQGLIWYDACEEFTAYDIGHLLPDRESEPWLGEVKYHNIIYVNFEVDQFYITDASKPAFWETMTPRLWHRHLHQINNYNFAADVLEKIKHMFILANPDIRAVIRHSELFHHNDECEDLVVYNPLPVLNHSAVRCYNHAAMVKLRALELKNSCSLFDFLITHGILHMLLEPEF